MKQSTLSAKVTRSLFGFAAALFVLLNPAPYVFAESADGSAPSASASCSPVAPAPSGIKQPTGSDAVTYTYNSCTGLWENAYYTWSPATQLATPKTPLIYTCDTATWRWKTQVWVYDPAAGKFTQITSVRTTLPAGAIIAANSLVPCEPAAQTPAPAGPTDSTTAASPDITSNTAAGVSNTTGVTVQTGITQTSLSGNAAVANNKTAGDATSGNALAMANVLNSLQSSSSLAGGNLTTFVANINGDIQGDLVVDPSQLQPATNSDTLSNAGVTVNNQTNGQIQNNITLAATSGAATVAGNTTAGSATSGDARAVANVINMINSVVSSGKSFVGVINVNGNLNGNILMPQSFLDSLIASNAPTSTLTLTKSQADSIGISNTNNLSVANNIQSSATSGAATVAGNTTAGSATTGDATTKVTIFNLTGSQVVGANCLLVFVNVSGKWVGVIMNAPAGATAAALGSGITSNNLSDTNVANTTNQSITNNIDVRAMSGAATVANNTNAGSATSGDASTAVNLLNMNGSQFSLAGWFGILFINIFGNWYGNFGVYTQPTGPVTGSNAHQSAGQPPAAPSVPKVFRFIPAAQAATPVSSDTPLTEVSAHFVKQTGSVLGSGVSAAGKHLQPTASTSHTTQVIGGLLVLVGLTTLAVEQYSSRRQARHTSI